MNAGQPGAPLPYQLLAGVEPCPGGWLVVSGKLHGINLHVEEPRVLATFTDVIDHRPAFAVVAVHAPVGLPSRPGSRACDREARLLLGWPRAGSIQSPPTRVAISSGDASGLSAVTRALFPKFSELDREMEAYRQRSIHEVNPELGFLQLNEDAPLRYPKRTELGRKERRVLLEQRIPGIVKALDASLPRVTAAHLLDAAVDLWTARRISAKAATRVPEIPEWDDKGLRMEILR
jgi:predicted RNase H-like nuclease